LYLLCSQEADQVDEEDRAGLACWKLKKWAVHILARIFERYGSPGNVTKEYTEFSEWYLKTFSNGVLNVLLKLLDGYRQKMYVAPRILQQTLNYVNQGISHAFSWKFIKPHMQDEELWVNDPHEYIRIKYDVFEDFLSPVMAAQTVFHSATSKRKEVLDKAMEFCMSILITATSTPRQRDGALHMVGAVAEVLLKRKMYKDKAEEMLVNHVFPAFSSEHGFLRARACWVIRYFSEMKFRSEQVLHHAVELVKAALCGDKDLPVRVEAAIAIQMLITEQEKAKNHIQPFVKPVILELLNVIRETENDDLTGVMQKLVCTYVEEVIPIAVEMMSHLAQTFAQVIESDSDGSEEKAITALGILNTMETILNVMEDQKEVLNANIGEDAEVHAAKLLEVILLQCPGKLDHVLGSFVELVLQRLTREVLTSELRTMCLQVVIAGMYYNTPLLFDTLTKVQMPNVQGSILNHFLKQWLHDSDSFLGLHDRKISVLGLCALLSMVGQRPQEVTEVAPQILPAALVLFQGLKRAYASRANEEESDSDDDDDDDEEAYDGTVLSSDEDEIDETSQQYLERLEKAQNRDADGYSDDCTDDGAEETALESYTTTLDSENCPIDEYSTFKNILTNLPNQDSGWYQLLMSGLEQSQMKDIEEVFKLAEQRKAAADSKKIEEGGGYAFTNRQVPTSFNFGSG
ncbi:importin-7, partial [Elysia marginata]